ncbi:MAG: hypothetical protein M1814_000499 [Vezdaea aestivalis]|nr:MAG: hypothetical protein M1814_000499 [Vezdaea aestivalis]
MATAPVDSRKELAQDSKPIGANNLVDFRHALSASTPLTTTNAPGTSTETHKNAPKFEDAEHKSIGDSIFLKLAGGQTNLAGSVRFTLANTLQVTYGEINGLAGDFYGPKDPISSGQNVQEQNSRFLAAYGSLANKSAIQPAEAQALLKYLQTEVDSISKAIQARIDPSTVYATAPDDNWNFVKLLSDRPESDHTSYVELSQSNLDHFGEDARIAYNVGHTAALTQAAQSTDPANLLKAYSMNAFCDHYLQDSFSAGHLRVPRRQLHSFGQYGDISSKLMHDEDNAMGLKVVNPKGDRFTVYGDAKLFDKVSIKTKELLQIAVQVSADEIYDAWHSGTVPAVASFQALKYAPTLISARDYATQDAAPLFTFDKQPKIRVNFATSRAPTFEPFFSLDSWKEKFLALWDSPHFKHPITFLPTHS